ncbi:hypothetical protein [Moorena producens]
MLILAILEDVIEINLSIQLSAVSGQRSVVSGQWSAIGLCLFP